MRDERLETRDDSLETNDKRRETGEPNQTKSQIWRYLLNGWVYKNSEATFFCQLLSTFWILSISDFLPNQTKPNHKYSVIFKTAGFTKILRPLSFVNFYQLFGFRQFLIFFQTKPNQITNIALSSKRLGLQKF